MSSKPSTSERCNMLDKDLAINVEGIKVTTITAKVTHIHNNHCIFQLLCLVRMLLLVQSLPEGRPCTERLTAKVNVSHHW